jgi:hypothetical protein
MNLQKLILTENDCYKAGQKIKPKGIMVHSTAANNPKLSRYVGPDDGKLGVNKNGNHWNQARPGGRQVCVHAFIGKLANGSIATYQTLPWDYRGWHAGGSANDTHIGFEICEDGLTDAKYFGKVYQEAVELCAHLCRIYDLTEKDIICHSEGYKKGVASNHADVMHWFPKHGKSMDTFRADVKSLLAPLTAPEKETEKEEAGAPLYRVQIGALRSKSEAEALLTKAKAAGFSDAFITSTSCRPVDEPVLEADFKVGDQVKLSGGATIYGKDTRFTAWVYNSTLYVREVTGDRIVVSTVRTGAITGAVHKKHLVRA